MEYEIRLRIKQLESQIDDPEVLDQKRVEYKLETYKEVLQLINSAPNKTRIISENEHTHKGVKVIGKYVKMPDGTEKIVRHDDN